MKNLKLLVVGVMLLLPLVVAPQLFARIGVGVGNGKVVVDQLLKPGQIYVLPALPVINTGDEEFSYSVSIAYHEKQPELMPDKAWFKFSPEEFKLKPGEIQNVKINLDLPIKAVPGKYFAYLEAAPVKETEEGKSSVGIAAAAKLYFEIVPASVIAGIYYKGLSLWNLYSPWSERVAGVVAVVILVLFFKKYFNVEIKSKSSNKEKKNG